MISASPFQRPFGFQLPTGGGWLPFQKELDKGSELCCLLGSHTQIQPSRVGRLREDGLQVGSVHQSWVFLFSPLPQLSCISVVKEGWLL